MDQLQTMIYNHDGIHPDYQILFADNQILTNNNQLTNEVGVIRVMLSLKGG